ncbi:YceD family protein [Novosphingobium sp. NPDC080210]|uniref:YceD family protein n=1 Tax=Novosphingobium sp. NPDC080210 TaxID=3390596 RepID=UPI003D04381A
MSELSRPYDATRLPTAEQVIEASAEECAALAQRFGLVAVKSLAARITLKADGPTVRATGQLKADVVQSCAVSGEDLPVKIAEPIALHFVPPADSPESEEEIELEAEDLDEIEMEGTRFDLGEAVAQSLALAIDPYLEGPGAEEVRKAGLLGQAESSPFAALKGLIKE